MIGTGYVGLVSGACFADFGHRVTCVDKDAQKIAALAHGDMPIYEPDLDRLVAENMSGGRLDFTTDHAGPVAAADAVFIAVGTPSRRGDGHADLTYVYAAAREIAASLAGFTVVVTKSTVPVGTGDEVERIIREARPDADVAVVSNPEFLREGAAIRDFKHPDRIVVGLTDERAKKVMAEIYRPLYLNQAPIVYTSRRTAELIKYAANAFLATKISFMNEIANLCDYLGADVDMVRKGIGTDPRIGPQFLFAGAGYGGSCFPKDVKALVRTGKDCRYELKILTAVESVNRQQRMRLVEKIVRYFDKKLTRKIIAVWGLSFKPNTEDMREAPSITIIKELMKRGAIVQAHDPVALTEARKYFGTTVKLFKNNYAALRKADALVVLTEWNGFRRPDFDRMKALMRGHVIFDGRNIYDPRALGEKGFAYFGIGRGMENGNT